MVNSVRCVLFLVHQNLSPTTYIIALWNADIGLLVEPNLFTQSAYIVSIAFECGSHLETYFAIYRAHAVMSTMTWRSTFAVLHLFVLETMILHETLMRYCTCNQSLLIWWIFLGRSM